MNTSKKFPKWRRQTVSTMLALTLLIPAASPVLAADAKSAAAERIVEVLDALEKNHVSGPKADKLSETGIRAMVESLGDPYTQYFTAEQLQSFEDAVENQYVGIGVRVGMEEEGVYVADVFAGSPAKEAGMLRGDIIVKVGDEPAAGKKIDEVTAKILGPVDTEVRLQVLRDGQTKELTIKRKKVQIPTVVAKRFQNVGYIEVASFSSDADELVSKELSALKAQGIQSLIVDLRDNPGGLLETAQQLARLFVKQGTLIHTRDRNGVDQPVEFANGTTQPFPVFFLVNGNSASASEVLTGALQDYGAITAIGTKTYGKGSVQNVIPLKSGGAIKVTIEEYLTPKLRKVNQVGLEPDKKVEGAMAQLLTAIRAAGASRIDLTLDRHSATVNGTEVQDTFDVIRENGQTYVPARVLGALLGASVEWNEAARTVQLVAADAQTSYTPAAADFVLKNGTGYLNVAQTAAAFNGLSWKDDGKTLTLGAN